MVASGHGHPLTPRRSDLLVLGVVVIQVVSPVRPVIGIVIHIAALHRIGSCFANLLQPMACPGKLKAQNSQTDRNNYKCWPRQYQQGNAKQYNRNAHNGYDNPAGCLVGQVYEISNQSAVPTALSGDRFYPVSSGFDGRLKARRLDYEDIAGNFAQDAFGRAANEQSLDQAA